MPRILVADDNSNIQKMVAHALQDASFDHIEVIAVSNGGAAIRALPDAVPDLVLADVFMPVRSGYEVCEFIKHEPPYANIPVVLLVGAFDPLDEKEAQRVAADGILKKPFVPPDPLINMIKTLLAKAADERLAAIAIPVSVSAKEGAASAAETPGTEYSDEPPEELAAPGKPGFGRHEATLAFGTLLETPVDDPSLVVTSARDPVLGPPIFGGPDTAIDDASVEEEVHEHSWSNFAPLPLDGETPSSEEEQKPPRIPLAPIEFGGNAHEKIEATFPPEIEAEPPLFEPAGSLLADLKEETPTGAPAEVASRLEIVPSPWETQAEPEAVEALGLHPSEEPAVAQVADSDAVPEIPRHLPDEPHAPLSALPPVFPGSESLWARPEPRRESEPAPSPPAEHAEPAPTWPPAFEPAVVASEEEIPAAEAEALAAPAEAEDVPEFAAPPASLAAAAPAAAPAAPDPELIEAIVTRIIERMQPKVIDVVTREILRPLVEALVHREINKH